MLVLGKRSECEVSLSLYELIYELNKIEPPVLLAVLPQLEFKLKVGVLFNLLNLILSQVFKQASRFVQARRAVNHSSKKILGE